MKHFFRNTLPALILIWMIFFIEVLSSDLYLEKMGNVFWKQELKIFIIYTVFALFIGGISSGIITTKKKKYSYFMENELRRKTSYLVKNISYVLLILFLLLCREMINQPGFYSESLLRQEFFLSFIFKFIVFNFSPLYFTLLLLIITAVFLHNVVSKLSLHDGIIRFVGYLFSLLSLIIIIFNYGWLNADQGNRKNFLIIGIEGLKNEQIKRPYLKKYKGFNAVIQKSYIFKNYFSITTDPRSSMLSILTSEHPEKHIFYNGKKTFGQEQRTVLNKLYSLGYKTAYISDKNFSYDLPDAANNSLLSASNSIIDYKSRIINRHNLSPIIMNNRIIIDFFKEIFYLDGYQDRTFTQENLIDLVNNKSSFAGIYIISKNNENIPYPYFKIINEENFFNAYMTYADDQIQMIYENLKRTGKLQNTYIILTGLPESKTSLKNMDYKLPFFIYDPAMESEKVINNNYTVLDVYPTVLDLAGVEKEKVIDGVSFYEKEFQIQNIILSDPIEKDKNFDSPMISRSLIRGDYKLNVTAGNTEVHYELYDIKKDPYEKSELSGERQTIFRKMIKIYGNVLEKDFGYKMINGYAFK